MNKKVFLNIISLVCLTCFSQTNSVRQQQIELDNKISNIFHVNELKPYKPEVRQIYTIYPYKNDNYLIQINSKNPIIKLLSVQDIFNIKTNNFVLNSYNIPNKIKNIVNTDLTVDALYDVNNDIFNLVIDTSKYQINIDETTYNELNYLKIETSYNSLYSSTYKDSLRLNDLSKIYDIQLYRKWIQILAENKELNIEQILNKQQHKIISEIRLEPNMVYNQEVKDILFQNLDILKNKLGYDTVLVRFDCINENEDDLKNLLNDIKSTGMKIYSTYVGLDNSNWTPYIDPEILTKRLSLVASLSDGWFLNWRSTSSHVKLLPIEYFNWICKTIRNVNKNILIYGEIYYGKIDPLRTTTLIYTSPKNISGYVINNMGYYGYNHSYIINNYFSKSVPYYNKVEKIGQVIGYSPYYATRKKMDLPMYQELYFKDTIETNFKNARCSSVTLLHDGADDNMLDGIMDDGTSWLSTDNILKDKKYIEMFKTQK